MRPNEVDRWVKHLQAQPSEGLDRRIDALLDRQPTALPVGGRRRTVRSRVARFAVAAAVLLAMAVSIPLFNGDHSNVWAQVLENTNSISNYTFRVVIIEKASGLRKTDMVMENEIYYVCEGNVRLVESYVDGRLDHKSYFVHDSNESILVYPATKEYERRPGVPAHRGTPRDMTQWLLTGRYDELGKKTVDGRVLAGLATRRVPQWQPQDIEDWQQEIWFDMETKLPDTAQLSFKSRRSGTSYVNRQDQFRYGVAFPPHLFEPNIPNDYTPTVVNGLRLFAELANGRYPRGLDPGTVAHEIGDRARVQNAIQAGMPPSGRYGYDGIMKAADFFFMVARASRDFGYYGHRVTAQDAQRVLACWSRSGPDYEVIWGDLRMETLSQDQLIQRCYANGDSACLLDFLEKDDGTRIPLLAEYLGQIGDESVVPTLLRRRDLWQGPPAGNPFVRALEAIRRRQEPQDPSTTLVAGRLLYANGRSVTQGYVRIGTAAGRTDSNGYFALRVPTGDPQASLLGYARQSRGASARLFLWSKVSQPADLAIVLEWAGTVHGHVVDQEGKPRSDIDVGLSANPGTSAGRVWPQGNQTKPDAQGSFVFELVPVGVPLEVAVENPAQAGNTVRVRIDDLAPDQTYELGDIVLSR